MAYINKMWCEAFRERFSQALKELQEELGVQIDLGSIKYSPTSARASMTISTITEAGDVNTPEADAFRRNAPMYGISPNWLGRYFRFQDKSYRVTGWKLRAKRYQIQAEGPDGRTYKFPRSVLIGAEPSDSI